jgi:hypothetical protein
MLTTVTPKERYNFLIDAEQREGLRRVKEREGIPESEQIRRAIDEWLQKKGATAKADRKRASTRQRS